MLIKPQRPRATRSYLGQPCGSPRTEETGETRERVAFSLFTHTHTRSHWPGQLTSIFLPCSFESFYTRLVLPVRAGPWSPKRIPTLVPPVEKKLEKRKSDSAELRVIVAQMFLPGPPAVPQSLKSGSPSTRRSPPHSPSPRPTAAPKDWQHGWRFWGEL